MPTAPCARQCSTLRQGEEVPESLLARATACFGKGWYTDCLHSSEPACHPQNFQSLVTLHSLQPSWCQLWAIAFSVPANFTSLKPNSRCHLSYNKSHRVPLPLRISSCTHCPFHSTASSCPWPSASGTCPAPSCFLLSQTCLHLITDLLNHNFQGQGALQLPSSHFNHTAVNSGGGGGGLFPSQTPHVAAVTSVTE